MLLQLIPILNGLASWLVWLILAIIALLILTFSLKVGINAVKGKETELGPVFVTGLLLVLITAVVGWFLGFWGFIIGFVIGLLIIKSRHDTSFFGALGAIIIAYIVLIIIMLVIVFLFFGSIAMVLDLINIGNIIGL